VITFTAADADHILTLLGAEIHHSPCVVGVVKLTENHRIRLVRPDGLDELPSFVFNKWKQTLRLSTDEMLQLLDGTLTGPAALEMTKRKLGLL
jgi:hypothetical protein